MSATLDALMDPALLHRLRAQPWHAEVDSIFHSGGILTFTWEQNCLRESEGDPHCVGDPTRGGSYGLFQINLYGLGYGLVVARGRTEAIRLFRDPAYSAKLMKREAVGQGVHHERDPLRQCWRFTREVERPRSAVLDQVYRHLFGEERP